MKKLFKTSILLLTLVCLMLPLAARAADSKFEEKSISSSSKNQTNRYTAAKTTTRKATKGFVQAMADTSIRLLQEMVNSEASGKNILISPDSILTAVSMVENGASGNTLSEMQNALGNISVKRYSQYLYTLHRRITKSKKTTYKIANSIWYRKGNIKLKSAFLKRIAGYYQAEVYRAPFHSQTVTDINNWVYNHTNGKIPSIIDRLTPNDRTVVINAIYFKGKWAVPYDDTYKDTFTLENGTEKKVNMLRGSEHVYVNIGGADGFVKNYEGGNLAFLGLLPPKGTSVKKFAASLTGSDFINGYKKRTTSNITVLTKMPEFRYDYSVSLKKALRKMGIKQAFTTQADFSKMSDTSTRIDEILHKTFIDLNKDGTEAAAVTAIMMKANSAYNPNLIVKEVYLDRPFLYAIIDTKTGIPLFIGVVGNP